MLNGTEKRQTATATLGDKEITFSIDNVNARINNKPAKMDVPARLDKRQNNGTATFPFGKYGI